MASDSLDTRVYHLKRKGIFHAVQFDIWKDAQKMPLVPGLICMSSSPLTHSPKDLKLWLTE